MDHVLIIGGGLMGSSVARAIKKYNLAKEISIFDCDRIVIEKCKELNLADHYYTDVSNLSSLDLIVIAVPVGKIKNIGKIIASAISEKTVITDVGSVKQSVINDLYEFLPYPDHFVPAHPIAGTEFSGPEAGYAELFANHWCILTPLPETKVKAIEIVKDFWEDMHMNIKIMSAKQHDLTLSLTSHLPHLIAFTIVGTAVDLEDDLKDDIIKFSAGGFRDFTRIAASNPVMWRDIFANNKEALLESLGRFTEDLTLLQKYIRRGHFDELQDYIARAKEIREGVIHYKQDKPDLKKNN